MRRKSDRKFNPPKKVRWIDQDGKNRTALIYRVTGSRAFGHDRTDFPRHDTFKYVHFNVDDIVEWDAKFPDGLVS